MANSFSALADSVEELLRKGRLVEARARLQAEVPGEVPHGQAALLAGLARRAGLPGLGVRCLHPIIRLGSAIGKITPSERAEYGACLVEIGAVDEAESNLRRIDPADAPEANAFRALPLLSREDYRGAIPFLMQYASDRRVREYPRALGKLALVDALVHDRQSSKAAALVEDMIDDSLFRRDPLLLGRALLSLAKNSVLGRKWEDARVLLSRSRESIERVGGSDLELIENWECFLEARRTENLAPLAALRQKRWAAGQWDVVRDCDLIEVLTTREKAKIARLFFGSPNLAFRERFSEMVGGGWTPPATFVWALEGDHVPGAGLDIVKEKDPQARALLSLLCSDFHRPIPIASIFFRLSPEAQYHPRLSADRVREALAQLANGFDAGHLPLYLERVGEAFRLRAKKPFGILVPNPGAPTAMMENLLLKWRHRFGHEPFGIGQAAAEIDASERATRALLEQAEQDGIVVREEGGRRIQFRLS